MGRFKPLIAASVVLGSLAAHALPSASQALIFDRELIRLGELWRAFTCHCVHFSPSHLAADIGVLVTSYLIAGREHFPRMERGMLAGLAAIGPALLIFDPHLAFYGGSSGLSSAAACSALLLKWGSCGTKGKALYLCLLLACIAKPLVELVFGSPGFAFLPEGVLAAPLSHLLGNMAALAVYFSYPRRPAPQAG